MQEEKSTILFFFFSLLVLPIACFHLKHNRVMLKISLQMGSLARDRSTKAENSKMDDSGAQTLEEPATKFQADEIRPLMGKPYFHVVLVRSHLSQMVRIPLEIGTSKNSLSRCNPPIVMLCC